MKREKDFCVLTCKFCFCFAGGQQNVKGERQGGGRQGARPGRRPRQGHPGATAGGHQGQRHVAHAHHRRPSLQHPDRVRHAGEYFFFNQKNLVF